MYSLIDSFELFLMFSTVQSLQSSARDRDLDDWLRQSLLRNSSIISPMPPRRRKYNIDVVEEEKPNSKRLKNSIMSSDRYDYQ